MPIKDIEKFQRLLCILQEVFGLFININKLNSSDYMGSTVI